MRARSTVLYTVLRLAFFLVPFAVMMLIPVLREQYWLAAIFAALIGLSLSIIFLRRPLSDMSAGIEERRATRATRAERARSDEDEEDSLA